MSSIEDIEFANSLELELLNESNLQIVNYSFSGNHSFHFMKFLCGDDDLSFINSFFFGVSGIDEKGTLIAHLDPNNSEEANKIALLDLVEPYIKEKGLHPMREGISVMSAVHASFIFLPTNSLVHGLSDIDIPHWNEIDECQFGEIARLSHATSDDNGKFIVVYQSDDIGMVRDMSGGAGWQEDHTNVVICRTPISTTKNNRSIRSLLVTVMKKGYAEPIMNIEQPDEDTWFDSLQEDGWTKEDDGTPLRGKLRYIA